MVVALVEVDVDVEVEVEVWDEVVVEMEEEVDDVDEVEVVDCDAPTLTVLVEVFVVPVVDGDMIVNALVQVCTDFACSNVVFHATVAVGPSHRQGTATFVSLTLPPDTYYVRVSDPAIATQTKIVTFGASPQAITFIIF